MPNIRRLARKNNLFSDSSFLDYPLSSKLLTLIKDRSTCEMTDFENCFLFSLLKEKKPKKILEIGVSGGATTLMILDYIKSNSPDTKLYSIDISEQWYRDISKKSGYIASEIHGECENWKLFLGKTYPECCDQIGDGIDFCILDTNHSLPGELLDFLAVLPSLQNDAVVVLHDTNLPLRKHNSPKIGDQMGYATKVVLDVAKGDKIVCKIDNKESNYDLPNISAIIIGDDTRQGINDMFSALAYRWNYIPSMSSIENYAQHYKKYFSDDHEIYFRKLINSQKILVSSFKNHVLHDDAHGKYDELLKRLNDIESHIKRHPGWLISLTNFIYSLSSAKHRNM